MCRLLQFQPEWLAPYIIDLLSKVNSLWLSVFIFNAILFLMKVKVESEKVGLKLNIQKTKIMATGPTTSWEIDGETKETVKNFILGGSKITADGDCSHEIKRCLLLEEKLWPN